VNATQMTPEARGLAVSLFALALFIGQSVGVALAAPIVDRYGARPVFAAAAAVLVVIGFWFRRQLIKRAAAGCCALPPNALKFRHDLVETGPRRAPRLSPRQFA